MNDFMVADKLSDTSALEGNLGHDDRLDLLSTRVWGFAEDSSWRWKSSQMVAKSLHSEQELKGVFVSMERRQVSFFIFISGLTSAFDVPDSASS